MIRGFGQSDTEWLADFFEYEVCNERGWDADRHSVVPGLLGRAVRCADPIPETLTDTEFAAEMARRCAISTR